MSEDYVRQLRQTFSNDRIGSKTESEYWLVHKAARYFESLQSENARLRSLLDGIPFDQAKRIYDDFHSNVLSVQGAGLFAKQILAIKDRIND